MVMITYVKGGWNRVGCGGGSAPEEKTGRAIESFFRRNLLANDPENQMGQLNAGWK